MQSPPVLILVKAVICPACAELTKMWNDEGDPSIQPKIMNVIRATYPDIYSTTITLPTYESLIDVNKAPKDLQRFINKLFPKVMLIPGPVWAAAMKDNNSRTNTKLQGVQVMNGVEVNGNAIMNMGKQYSTGNPQQYVEWITACLANPKFKELQQTVPTTIISPTVVKPSNVSLGSSIGVCKYRLVGRPN